MARPPVALGTRVRVDDPPGPGVGQQPGVDEGGGVLLQLAAALLAPGRGRGGGRGQLAVAAQRVGHGAAGRAPAPHQPRLRRQQEALGRGRVAAPGPEHAGGGRHAEVVARLGAGHAPRHAHVPAHRQPHVVHEAVRDVGGGPALRRALLAGEDLAPGTGLAPQRPAQPRVGLEAEAEGAGVDVARHQGVGLRHAAAARGRPWRGAGAGRGEGAAAALVGAGGAGHGELVPHSRAVIRLEVAEAGVPAPGPEPAVPRVQAGLVTLGRSSHLAAPRQPVLASQTEPRHQARLGPAPGLGLLALPGGGGGGGGAAEGEEVVPHAEGAELGVAVPLVAAVPARPAQQLAALQHHAPLPRPQARLALHPVAVVPRPAASQPRGAALLQPQPPVVAAAPVSEQQPPHRGHLPV